MMVSLIPAGESACRPVLRLALLCCYLPCAWAQAGPCAGGAHPSCPDGARPTGQPPSCTGGGRALCPDGSAPIPGGAGGSGMGGLGGGGGAGDPISTSPHAAAMLGDVGRTTVTGTVARTGQALPVGENIYGPFEAGFGTQQDGILAGLGCSPGSLGHVAGGIDTHTAEQMVAHQCGVTLPRVVGQQYISLLDECGGHTQEYHFHERLRCLYDGTAGGHSTKVGQTNGGQPLYGKWEDTAASQLPQLDACGGHYGRTPESPSADVYHYHVQVAPPFAIGCLGPNTDGTLVTVQQCRSFYTGCDGSLVTITTSQGSRQYDYWCPCWDAQGSNTGVNIAQLPVFATLATGALTVVMPAGTDACTSSFRDVLKESLAESASSAAAPNFTKSDVLTLSMSGCAGSLRRRLQATFQVVATYTLRAADSAAAQQLRSGLAGSPTASADFAASVMLSMRARGVNATVLPATVASVPNGVQNPTGLPQAGTNSGKQDAVYWPLCCLCLLAAALASRQ